MFTKSTIVFIFIYISLFILTLLYTPFWGVISYVLVYFLSPTERFWWQGLPEFRFSFIVAIITIFSFLMRYNSFKDNKILSVNPLKWLIAMSIIVILATLWAVNLDIHINLMAKYFKTILFSFLIFKIIDTPKKMDALLLVYILGITYVSLLGWQSGRTHYGRLELIGASDLVDANGTAAACVTSIPFFVFYALFGKKRSIKIFALIGFAFVINCLILINSRGAFLSLITIFILYFLEILKYNKKNKFKIVASFIVCILLFFYLADEIFWNRMNLIINNDTNEVSRVLFWFKTFDMLRDHPFGMGGWGYALLSKSYLPAEWLAQDGSFSRAVHSLWFEVLSEYGYQGLIVFSGFIYTTFSLIFRVKKLLLSKNDMYLFFQATSMQYSLIALLVCCTFINFFYVEIIYWLPIMICSFSNIYMLKVNHISVSINHGKNTP